MKVIDRIGLIVEFILCFLPITYLWLLSLLAFPLSVGALLSSFRFEFALFPLSSIFGGAGLFGAFNAFAIIFYEKPVPDLKLPLLFFACGLAASIAGLLMFGISEPISWAIYAPPAVANWHFIYLLRKTVAQAANKTLQSPASQAGTALTRGP